MIILLSAGDQSESLQVINQTINAGIEQLAGRVIILAFGLKTGLQSLDITLKTTFSQSVTLAVPLVSLAPYYEMRYSMQKT